jgi:hypothetical protein
MAACCCSSGAVWLVRSSWIGVKSVESNRLPLHTPHQRHTSWPSCAARAPPPQPPVPEWCCPHPTPSQQHQHPHHTRTRPLAPPPRSPMLHVRCTAAARLRRYLVCSAAAASGGGAAPPLALAAGGRPYSSTSPVVDQMLQYVTRDLQASGWVSCPGTVQHRPTPPMHPATNPPTRTRNAQGQGQAAIDVLRSGLSMVPDPASGHDAGRCV